MASSAFVAAGDEIVTDVEARIAEIPQTDRPSALILWKYADGVPQVSGQGKPGMRTVIPMKGRVGKNTA